MTVNPLIPLDQWILLAALLLGGGLAIAWRSSATLPPRLRIPALFTRALALAALALIALNIGVWRRPGTEQRPHWQVLIDRSGSMATEDAGGGSRWRAAGRLAAQLETASSDRRDLSFSTFSGDAEESLHRAANLSGIHPDGEATRIGRALRTVTDARAARSGTGSGGIVLLSDGRQTDGGDDPRLAGLLARAQQAPVLAVPFGVHREKRDIAVRVTRRLLAGFAGQPVRIQGEVQAHWPGEIEVAVRLVEDSGRAVATNTVRLRDGARERVSFSVTPGQPGSAAYSLHVVPWEGERDARNNEAPFEIQVLDRKIRVLMAEGVPFWDSKFLGQLLRRQPNLDVTSVQRTAPERFIAITSDGASQTDATGLFPDHAAALEAYDIVVFGRGAEYFITPERSAALKRFVTDRGGCVVFARGPAMLEQGEGLEDLEPVEWGGASAMECRLVPCGEGEDIGLFAGLLPGRGDPVWERLPPVRCSRASLTLKSFAQVLAEGRRTAAGGAPGPRVPLLVSRRLGKGLTVALNIDGLWQWAFFPTSREAAVMYEEFWAQLLLWAGTYAEFLPGHQYALHLSSSATPPHRPVRVIVRRRGGVVEREAPLVRVTRGEETVRELALAAGTNGDGWEGLLELDAPGLYRVVLLSPEGTAAVGAPAALLQVEAPPAEGDDVNPDPDYLARLAEASGGSVVTAHELVAAMARREAEAREPRDAGAQAVWVPLWDRGWLLVVIMAALATEWTLRRRNGLA